MLSEQMKKLRSQNSISQRELAEKLFVSQQTVAKWETEGATPNPEMLSKMADFFNVSVDYLLGKENYLCSQLIALCRERGIKLEEMCDAVGLNREAALDIRVGRLKMLTAGTAKKVADFFGVEVSCLYSRGEEKEETTGGELSEKNREYVEKIKRMSPEQLKMLDIFLKGMGLDKQED